MESIFDSPYTLSYPEIIAIASEDGRQIELVEKFDCTGGAMWVGKHYAKSPLVKSVRVVGSTQRFMLEPGIVDLALEGSYFPAGISGAEVLGDEIGISYIGMGGGGVGASICRASAKGVLRAETDPSGGGKVAGTRLWLPRMQRIVIGIDDTDTAEEGATWTLAHNISRAIEDERSRYLSHTIVQLFPVPYRTKNCVAVACEFATTDPAGLIDNFERLVREYTLSEETGLAAFRGFDTSPLAKFGRAVKAAEVTATDLEEIMGLLDVRMDGRGLIGAAAAIPYYTNYEEALKI